MKLPDDKTKFTAQFKYVELGRYVPKLDRLTREMKDHEPVVFEVEDIPAYAARNNNVGIYSSVFQYNGTDIGTAASLGPVYFDLDASDAENSKVEAFRLVEHLLTFIPEGGIRLYFSGQKGFHIECEPIALGITPTDEPTGVYRFIAEDLKDILKLQTMDFKVYDQRRMWRIPNSQHQHSGLYKVECMQLFRDRADFGAILKYAEKPRTIDTPEQSFDPIANQWYREYTYRYEQSKQKKETYNIDLVNRFLTEGSSNIRHYDQERMFDAANLMKNCSAVWYLYQKAYREHHLDHYERLFLCSLLTYNEEAVHFLHEILSQCSDYTFTISQAHIEDWIKRREYDIGGRPFTCQKATEVGISCSDCSKMEPKKKVVKLESGSYIETEEYSSPSPIRHAYKAKRLTGDKI